MSAVQVTNDRWRLIEAFERKGIAGDWRNHFDPRSCELLERHEGESLRRLGYEADASWIERFVTT